jgi:hypothetical protein
MTGSPSPAPHRETGTEDVNDHILTSRKQRQAPVDLPVLNSMRRTAPPSRPYGRYAVGLRPSLDPDAYFDAPSQDKEAPKQTKTTRRLVLTGPSPSGMTCEDRGRSKVGKQLQAPRQVPNYFANPNFVQRYTLKSAAIWPLTCDYMEQI